MTLTHKNYLSLKVILSEVIGHPALIVLVGLAIVTYLCIKFNVGGRTTIFIDIIAAIALLGFAFQQEFVIIIALVVGLVLYSIYAAVWNR